MDIARRKKNSKKENWGTYKIMSTLDNVTTDNIQAVGKTGKDIIDYITDQIDKVVNDKEENKK